MLEAEIHISHKNFETYGRRLEVGDVVEKGDVERRRNGRWEKCGSELFGKSLEKGYQLVVVRPLPVAKFPPDPLPPLKLKKGQVREVSYTCRSCRFDLRAYFRSSVGTIRDGKLHRDPEAEAALNRALHHMTKGSTIGKHHISCESCWQLYNKSKRKYCGG